jgi:hypothetical protein
MSTVDSLLNVIGNIKPFVNASLSVSRLFRKPASLLAATPCRCCAPPRRSATRYMPAMVSLWALLVCRDMLACTSSLSVSALTRGNASDRLVGARAMMFWSMHPNWVSVVANGHCSDGWNFDFITSFIYGTVKRLAAGLLGLDIVSKPKHNNAPTNAEI